MKRVVKLNWYVWLYPILFFLIALYGFKDSGGTDFERQISILNSFEYGNLSFSFSNLLNNEEKTLYQSIYVVLNQLLGISPRLYIALITFVYFSLILLLLRYFCSTADFGNSSAKFLSNLCVFTCLCFCPVLFAISRNLCAVVFLYAGLLFVLKKRYIIGLVLGFSAYFVHEGILIMYSILVLGWALYYFWIRKSRNYFTRNLIIIIISAVLLLLGSSFFSSITSFWFESGLLSEHYMDSYGTQTGGDGIYKTVIVLSMLGPLICLFANCLVDRQNSLIYSISVAGLFVICLLYNQKIFLVQRIMIFMPVFIGLTSYQICSYYIRQKGVIDLFYWFIMLLVPINLLFQFVIQFKLYFGNFF